MKISRYDHTDWFRKKTQDMTGCVAGFFFLFHDQCEFTDDLVMISVC